MFNAHNLTEKWKLHCILFYYSIVNDKVADHHYKEAEDLTKFKSTKTDRGPLDSDWLEKANPVMCSYKLVSSQS